jgi:hypothetical protein
MSSEIAANCLYVCAMSALSAAVEAHPEIRLAAREAWAEMAEGLPYPCPAPIALTQ